MVDPMPADRPISFFCALKPLFNTFSLAVFSPARLMLAFAAVVTCYLTGRLLDAVWRDDCRAPVMIAADDALLTAPEAFARHAGQRYADWERAARDDFRRAAQIAGAPGATGDQRTLAARLRPRGPFDSLLLFESDCVSAALSAALAGRVAYNPAQTSLLGALAAGGAGFLWLVSQHPFYALLFGLMSAWILNFCGTAIARSVAIETARGQPQPLSESFAFARSNRSAVLLLPLILLGLSAVLAIALVLISILGSIPVVGEIVAGLLFVVALLIGGILAFTLLAWAICGHLFVPAIAVEGAGAMESVTRAGGYVGNSPWRFSLYSLLLLIYGALCFVMLRLFVFVALKVTHVCVDTGMSIFGRIRGRGDGSLTKLDAMWHMPAWSELSLLPGVGSIPFYGTFGNPTLAGAEWFASGLIQFWIFIVVGLLAAALVSFYFVGCTRIFLLLRRDVDGEPYEHIYEEAHLPAESTPVSLAVVSSPTTGSEPSA